MFQGAFTALVTPFKDGVVDEKAFAEFIEWQIASGIHGLVPCGTTGESATLSDEEHTRVIAIAVEVANKRVPVIAGTGSNETVIAVKYTQHAKDVGADAALVVAPYYNRPNQEGIYQHFKAIDEAVDMPVFVYNVPSRCGVDITNETMGRLSKLKNVVGCKDATGDLTRVTEMIDLCGDEFVKLTGDDPTALGYCAHGGVGGISVGSNIAPAEYAAFFNSCAAGDFATAKAQHEKLDRLHKDLFLDPSPAPTKYALSLMGKMNETVRLPMTLCQDNTKEAVKAAMNRAGVKY